jgi:hypothetical protein
LLFLSAEIFNVATTCSTTAPPPAALDLVFQIVAAATFKYTGEVSAKSAEIWPFYDQFLISVFSAPANFGRRRRTPPGHTAPPKFFLFLEEDGWAVKWRPRTLS